MIRMPLLFALLALVGGCRSATLETSDLESAPYVVVLGTAQDGGLPQVGCVERLCSEARVHPERARLVASLLIVDPRSGKRWLIDATPDIRRQVERARPHPPTRSTPGSRPPLFEGVFLTHAHVGHYTGLIHLGREAYGAQRTPVFGSERMNRFLTENGPWSLLVSEENIVLRTLVPDSAVRLGEDLEIRPFLVPHRDEFTDTFGFEIRGPGRSVLYVPDIDKWDRWSRSLETELARVDVALLDGTFFADGEIPGRSMKDIPHPFVRETLERLSSLPEAQRGKVWFTHLNHTNPASDPTSAAAKDVTRAGAHIAEDGQIVPLGRRPNP